MKIKRWFQVFVCGWKHAGAIAPQSLVYRIKVFLDMLHCYRTYHMWSNQYLKESFHKLPSSKRQEIGSQYFQRNTAREEWVLDHLKNKRFFNRWGGYNNEVTKKKIRNRLQAYSQRYNMGAECNVSFDVLIDRKHFLPGTIRIGNRCLLGKHVHLDYSGFLEIGNDVQIAEGACVFTHYHKHHSTPNNAGADLNNDVQTRLQIQDGAVIGARAIILPTCNFIGRFARVGAGAVVTKDVPEFAIVAGVPARIIRIMNNS